jgi:hypothetical protein
MYVATKDACKHYNVSPSTLRRWADSGQIKVNQTAEISSIELLSLRSVTASRVPQTIWYNYRNNCIK